MTFALMSNLPQVFTNRTVWFIFPTIVDKMIDKTIVINLLTIVGEMNKTVRFVKTCGKLDGTVLVRSLGLNFSSASKRSTSKFISCSFPKIFYSGPPKRNSKTIRRSLVPKPPATTKYLVLSTKYRTSQAPGPARRHDRQDGEGWTAGSLKRPKGAAGTRSGSALRGGGLC
jgi:hypothetical protein